MEEDESPCEVLSLSKYYLDMCYFLQFSAIRLLPHSDGGRELYYFFVITNTPFQSSGGGLSKKSIERWM